MKHMMRFEIIQPIVGAFQSEANGWEHAQEVANGAEVRLVQSRQVDQDQTELKDLKASKFEPELEDAEEPVMTFMKFVCCFLAGVAIGIKIGGIN